MKQIYAEIELAGESFYLLLQKALYRPAVRQLILSDVHLGKATHFRKKGIAMPAVSHLSDIDRLQHLIKIWNPAQVLLLGDLFHSDYNREWLWFRSLVLDCPETAFILVEGNHDLLPEKNYELPNLSKVSSLEEPLIVFTHAPLAAPAKLNICGHVHPGIRLTGIARQSVRLPCYYHAGQNFILPAFGKLTGLQLVEKKANTVCYAITGETIVRL